MHLVGPRGTHSPVAVALPGQVLALANDKGLQIPLPPSVRSTSSRGDFGELTQRMDTLDLTTEEMSQNLTEHVAQTQYWQHHANAQFSNFNNMMQCGTPQLRCCQILGTFAIFVEWDPYMQNSRSTSRNRGNAEYLSNNPIVMPGQRIGDTIDMGNLPVHYQTRPSPASKVETRNDTRLMGLDLEHYPTTVSQTLSPSDARLAPGNELV
uniref:Uncharacterized protein n=1 Tax=Leersia perrieri TaxID=77586 RepID=A0A0D9VW65_9ORYZ